MKVLKAGNHQSCSRVAALMAGRCQGPVRPEPSGVRVEGYSPFLVHVQATRLGQLCAVLNKRMQSIVDLKGPV